MKNRASHLLPLLMIFVLLVNTTPGYTAPAYAEVLSVETNAAETMISLPAMEWEARVYAPTFPAAVKSGLATANAPQSSLPAWFASAGDRAPVPSYVRHFQVMPAFGFSPASHTIGSAAGGDVALLPVWYALQLSGRVEGDPAPHLVLAKNVDSWLPAWFAVETADLNADVRDGAAIVASTGVRVTGPAEVHNCEAVTFTIVIANDAVTTTNVAITSSVPSGSFNPTEIFRNLGTLTPNQVITLEHVFSATCAAVSGQHQLVIDQDGQDTVLVVTDYVMRPGAITVRKAPSVVPAQVGDEVTWTVLVENTGYGPVYNVRASDVLSTGLRFTSGQTQAQYSMIPVGETRSFTVAAEVVACSGLENNVAATWGCGEDACQTETAKASIDLKLKTPLLSYTPPPVVVDYCSNSGHFEMPIANIGQGTAHDVFIGVDMSGFVFSNVVGAVYTTTPQPGFLMDDPIPAGGVFTLTYDAAFPEACSSGSSGSLLYEPKYYDDCGNPFLAPVRLGSWSRSGNENVPSLSVSKSMPAEIQLGDVVTPAIVINARNITETVTITDALPPDWTVEAADGGSVFTVAGQTYITWSGVFSGVEVFNPVLGSPRIFGGEVCAYCGQRATNSVVAFVPNAGCQDCPLSPAIASASTEIQCNVGIASAKQVAPSSNETCSTYRYTDTLQFGVDLTDTTWSSMVLTETMANAQQLVSGTVGAIVYSGTESLALNAFPSIVGGQLIITFTGLSTVPVAGSTLVVSYELETTDQSQSKCSNRTWFDWTYFDSGTATGGMCGDAGVSAEGVFVTSLAPAMTVDLSGLPPVVHPCGAYTVTVHLDRTSAAPAYSSTLHVPTSTYAILEVTGFGGLTPVATTTDGSGYHFDYDDLFTTGTTATVDLRVQLGCGAMGAAFTATADYANHCGDTCMAGGTLGSPRLLEPASVFYKFPEIIYAAGDIVTWTLTIINSGAGTSYGVTVTDTLGSGLRYVSSSMTSTFPAGKLYTPITSSNLVTWSNMTCEPGEKKTIELAAEIVSCDDLTNKLYAAQGCHGETCRSCGPIPSRVVLPGTLLINTNDFLNPLPQCLTRTVTATVRNVGLMSVYSATMKETIPAGAYYVISSTEYAVGSGTTAPISGWVRGGEPAGAPGGPLQWTASQIPILARLQPKETVWVRFVLRASCAFQGGSIEVQTSYQDVCGTAKATSPSRFIMNQSPPQLTPQKQGRNLTTGSAWGNRVYAEPGNTVEWRISLANGSQTPALLVVVTDTLPTNLTYSDALPAPTSMVGRTLTWNLGTLTSTTWSALITTTVPASSCTASDTTNVFTASWGCDDGCRQQTIARAYLRTRPQMAAPTISTTLSPPTLPGCGGLLTVTFRNDGPPAYQVVMSNTLPPGFVYSETVYSSTLPSTVPSSGDVVPVWGWDMLPTGIMTLTFRVAPGFSGECAAPLDGTSVLTVTYDDVDACTITGPYTLTAAQEIDVITPSLRVAKTPLNQTVGAGEVATWTITLTNSGQAAAENLTIVDRLGNGFNSAGVLPLPADGTITGAGPITITWEGVDLDLGETWTRMVTATIGGGGVDQRNTVDVSGQCAGGCTYASISTTAYASAFQFGKAPEVQTDTIGALVQHTLAISYYKAVTYSDAFVVDTLPAGLAYYTSTVALNGGAATPISPTMTAGNVITFSFGSGTGPLAAVLAITSVIRNAPGNQDGAQLTNEAAFVWNELQGGVFVPFVETDTARTDVVEPDLAINKGVRSSTGSVGSLDGTALLTYTLRLTNSGSSPAYDVFITDAVPSGISVTAMYGGDGRSLPVQGAGILTWTVGVISHTTPGANNPLVLTYTARLSAAAASGGRAIWLTNRVSGTYSSLPDDPPPGEERDYGPITDTERVNTAKATTSKTVAPTSSSTNNLRVGDVVTYTIVNQVPPGLVVWWPYQYDTLPAGLRYVTGSLTITSDMPFVGASPLATGTVFVSAISPNTDRGVLGLTASNNPNSGAMAGTASRQAVEWWLQPLDNVGSATSGTITITFQAQLVGTELNTGDAVWLDQLATASLRNDQVLNWIDSDVGSYTTAVPTIIVSANVTSHVGQPQLGIFKSAQPSPGAYVGAGQRITYTLAVSNNGRASAYDILITDTLPAGLVYQSVAITCSSPTTASLVQQPAMGATGPLTFSVDQLNGLDATLLESVKWLTLTVVARVTDTIGANLLLRNVAAVPYYDSQPGLGPQTGLTPTQRTYADGNSAVEHRTVNADLAKLVTYSPPPTATLGTLVTYTLIVPGTPITATLYEVVVTDAVDSRLRIEGVAVAGGVNSAVNWAGQAVTATFDSIGYGTQAYVTVTARISDGFPNVGGDANAGDVIPDVGWLAHRDGPPAVSNQVDVVVGEPRVSVEKSAASSTGIVENLDGTVTLTYTLRLVNSGTSPAYSIHVTDVVPAGISVTTQYGGDVRGGPVVGSAAMTWVVASLSNEAGSNVVELSYTARLTRALPSALFTNTVDVLYHSLTETIPGVRSYTDRDDEAMESAGLTLAKGTTPPELKVGDVVTYSLVFTVPAGLAVPFSQLADTLPLGVRYITGSETLIWTPGGVNVLTTAVQVTEVFSRQVVRWEFEPITSELALATVVTMAFRAQATGQPGSVWPQQTIRNDVLNDGRLLYFGGGGLVTRTDTARNDVVQPSLDILKWSIPSPGSYVGAGDLISYTLRVTNSGYAPAYDIVISDTLPAGVDYVRTISSPQPAGAVVTPVVVGRQLVYSMSELAAGPGASMVITVVARVTDTVGANTILRNLAGLPYYDSQPGPGPQTGLTPTQRTYADGSSAVEHYTIGAGIFKVVTPATATLGSAVIYVIRVPQSPITATLYAVTVTDELDGRLQLSNVDAAPDGFAARVGNAFTVTYASISNGQQRDITVTAVLSDPLGATAGQVITNVATLAYQDGAPVVSNEPVFTVTEPTLVLGKSSDPAAGSVVVAGQKVTYTVRVTNASGLTASAAYDVAFEDVIPDGMWGTSPVLKDISINGVLAPPGSYVGGWNAGTGQYTFTVVSPTLGVPPGGVFLVEYVVTVDADIGTGIELENLASVNWSSLGGLVPGDRAYGPVTDTVVLETPLATGLLKAVAPAEVTIGSQVRFTITLPTPAVGATMETVVLTDIVDSRLRVDGYSAPGATSSNLAGNRLNVSYATIPAYAQREVLITATVRDLLAVVDGIQIPNHASLDYSNNPAGQVDSNVVTVTVREPQLALSKVVSVGRDPVGAGDRVTYTLSIENNGSWPAYDTAITDVLPSGLTFADTHQFQVSDPLTATLSDTNLPGSGVLRYGVSQVNVSGRITVVFIAIVDAAIGAGQTLVNVAGGATSGQPGSNADERRYDILTDTVPIESGAPSMHLVKTAEPAPVTPGDALTYTVTVSNSGIVSATDVVITDLLPSSTLATYGWCSPLPCQRSGNVVSWPIGILNVGEERTVQLVVTPTLGLLTGTLIVNRAAVTNSQGQRAEDSVTSTVDSGHTLNIFKSADPSPVAAGGVLTYGLHWAVTGVENAPGMVIRDVAPANSTYLSCQPAPCQLSGGEVVWQLGDQLYNANGVVTFSVIVTQPLLDGSLVINTAFISDAQKVTNTTRLETPVTSEHTLRVSKEVDPELVAPAGLLTYTLLYTVAGNGTAPDVTLSDNTPAGTTYFSSQPEALVHPSVGAVGAVRWLLGDLLPPASGILLETGVLTVVVRADPALRDGSIVVNTVTITDGSFLSDTDRATSTVESSHVVQIAKTAAVTQAVWGDLITYTMWYTIAGNEPSAPYVRDDVNLPTTYVAATGGVSIEHPAVGEPGTVIWHLGTVTPTETTPVVGSVDLVVRVSQMVTDGQQLPNEASIHSAGRLDDDTITTTLLAPVMHMAKRSAAADPVRPGDTITYQVCYSNSGSALATNVVITDFVPFNTSYVPGSVTAGAGDVFYYDGVSWQSSEPLTVTGLRWVFASVAPAGTTACVGFQVTVNPIIVLEGVAMELTAQGWLPLTATQPITVSPTPELTPTATATLTPTAQVSPTATAVVTLTLTPVATATPATATPAATLTPTATAAPTATPPATATAVMTGATPAPATATAAGTLSFVDEVTVTATPEPPTPISTPAPAPTDGTQGEDWTEASQRRVGFWPALVSFLGVQVLLQPVAPERSQPASMYAAESHRPALQAELALTATPTPFAGVDGSQSPPLPGEDVPTATATAVSNFQVTPTLAPAVEIEGMVLGEVVNVRAGPGTDYEVIGKAYAGESLVVSSRNGTGDWVVVMDNALTGWVRLDMLEVSGDVSGLPMVEVSGQSQSGGEPAATAVPVVDMSAWVMETVVGSIVNTATMTSDQAPAIIDTVHNPLLSTVDPFIHKTGRPAQASVGNVVTFTLTVGNNGDTVAQAVVVTDALPIYLDVLSAVSTKGSVSVSPSSPPQTVVVHVGDVAPGELVTITIMARVNRNAEPTPRDIENQAEMSCAGVQRQSEMIVVHVPKSKGKDKSPTLTPAPVGLPTPTATPTEALLPVDLLPETGQLPEAGVLYLVAVLSLVMLVGATAAGSRRRRSE